METKLFRIDFSPLTAEFLKATIPNNIYGNSIIGDQKLLQIISLDQKNTFG
jgi:hypothetical protein